MSETALLQAVREHLIARCNYTTDQCLVEFDEDNIPAINGGMSVLVIPNGWTLGPEGNRGGGVLDEVYSVQVSIVKRINYLPRDRRSKVAFIHECDGLNAHVRKVIAAIHMDYTLANSATALINGNGGEGFIHPLAFANVEPKPRLVPGEYFGSTKEGDAALARAVRFGQARRMQHAGQMQ